MPSFIRLLPPVAILGVTLLVTLSLPSASAQVLRGHDTTAPVDFSADRIEVQDRADRVVVAGNVQADQAGLHMTAARLTVAYHDTKGVEIDRLDAAGGVVITRADERASGDAAIYDLNRKLITLIGHVQLNQGTNRLSGGRLVMDLATGRTTVDGAGASAGAAPGVTTTSNGRVSGTFKVRQTVDQSAK